MGGIWSFFKHRDEILTRQKQQQLIIQEIESIEACCYCYIDRRLEALLLPYAHKSYPWDIECDILPYFRENSNYQPNKCYHCLKGQLKDHLTCQIIDKIFQKTTHKCQCEVPSTESSEISLYQLTEDDNDNDENDNIDNDNQSSVSVQFNQSSPPFMTDTDESVLSDLPLDH